MDHPEAMALGLAISAVEGKGENNYSSNSPPYCSSTGRIGKHLYGTSASAELQESAGPEQQGDRGSWTEQPRQRADGERSFLSIRTHSASFQQLCHFQGQIQANR